MGFKWESEALRFDRPGDACFGAGFLTGETCRHTPPEPAQMLTLPDWWPSWRG